jgi:hypothetical protein
MQEKDAVFGVKNYQPIDIKIQLLFLKKGSLKFYTGFCW